MPGAAPASSITGSRGPRRPDPIAALGPEQHRDRAQPAQRARQPLRARTFDLDHLLAELGTERGRRVVRHHPATASSTTRSAGSASAR